MGFQLSPGVNVSEIDLTTIIPAVATTDGAFAGLFAWGPVDEVTLVNTQETLLSTFGKPDNNVAEYWFTASNFLDYGNKLHLVRVVEDNVLTGGANTAAETQSASARLLIKNDEDYLAGDPYGSTHGKWAAKFPGDYGNNLRVSICDSYPGQFSNAATLQTANTVAGSKDIYITSNTTGIAIGDEIKFRTSVDTDIATSGASVAGAYAPPAGSFTITALPQGLGSAQAGSPTSFGQTLATLDRAVSTSANNVAIDRYWQFYRNFDIAPGTSAYAEARSAANDEIHIAVSDSTGAITGVRGTVLETFPNLSKASDAKAEDGSTIYYKDVINQSSSYIRWLDAPDTTVGVGGQSPGATDHSWGDPTQRVGATEVESYKAISGSDTRGETANPWMPDTKDLKGGNNGITTSASAFQLGYDYFKDADELDISMVLGGPCDGTVANYIIENIAEDRKDCVAFISPQKADVTGTATLSTKLTNVKDFRLTTDGINSKSSSYGVMDSGWKYQYDKFNDKYRWVPLNGDIAGLCVRTDQARDPWWSPAGLNRGGVKNVVKLAWNPQKAHRDELYKNGINPVVTLPGQGTVLYGDKTLQVKPSAFDRINVRRLFIVLEKAIATAAKFTLFEFNDEFTRSQFKNMVEPFLRDVMGRRGIYDFRVVCDESNNTGEVIDRNEFIGDIYIKPARSINFIQLNFVAVRTGVDFSEVVGKF